MKIDCILLLILLSIQISDGYKNIYDSTTKRATMDNIYKNIDLQFIRAKLSREELEGKYGKYITLYDKKQETVLLKICEDSFILEVEEH